MSTLVLGSRGQLAQHLREVLQRAAFWGRLERSLEDPVATEAAILTASPSLIVNAAAYTAVDKAEEEPAEAWRINAEGAASAARAAEKLEIPLIHISTDYVFDGASEMPYRDTDAARPVNAYGRTKLAGELAVASLCSRYWILRTSWVFSEASGNFVTTMLRLANERDQLRVVADQRGCPTYAGDLARVIAALIASQSRQELPWGIYHVSGGAAVSWHQFAESIVVSGHAQGLIKHAPGVHAIATDDFPTRASRPRNSVLEPSQALRTVLDFEPDWQLGLEKVLARLKSGGSQ